MIVMTIDDDDDAMIMKLILQKIILTGALSGTTLNLPIGCTRLNSQTPPARPCPVEFPTRSAQNGIWRSLLIAMVYGGHC